MTHPAPGPAEAEIAEPAAGRLDVSLVVPLRNEEASVARLVDSIRGQTRRPAEVVLVDGGSEDRTVERLKALTEGDPAFRIVEAGPASPGRGRNVGIAAARHDWVALTDAGIRLEPTWLQRLTEAAERAPAVAVVYGNYEPVTDTFLERCAALAYVPPKQYRDGGRMRGPSIASALVLRRVWDAAGGFPDLRAAEDLIFMRRVEELGFPIGWAPEATVRWELRPTLRSTFSKFRVYSRANVWAGQQRYWHYGLVRQYLLASPFVLLAAVHHPGWLAVPAAGFAARVCKSVWVRREGHGLGWVSNPLRLAGVGAVLATIDLATFCGWAQARLSTPADRTRGQGVHPARGSQGRPVHHGPSA